MKSFIKSSLIAIVCGLIGMPTHASNQSSAKTVNCTSNANALQEAIDRAPATGQRIKVYGNCSAIKIVNKDIELLGQKGAKISDESTASSKDSDYTLIQAIGNVNVSISDFEVATVGDEFKTGMYFGGGASVSLKNITQSGYLSFASLQASGGTLLLSGDIKLDNGVYLANTHVTGDGYYSSDGLNAFGSSYFSHSGLIELSGQVIFHGRSVAEFTYGGGHFKYADNDYGSITIKDANVTFGKANIAADLNINGHSTVSIIPTPRGKNDADDFIHQGNLYLGQFAILEYYQHSIGQSTPQVSIAAEGQIQVAGNAKLQFENYQNILFNHSQVYCFDSGTAEMRSNEYTNLCTHIVDGLAQ